MSYAEYAKHYFTMPDCILFLLLTILLLAVVYAIFYVFANKVFEGELKIQHEFFSLSERFYELIFSGGSIIGFMAVYYLINRFVTSGSFYEFWSDYKDYLLLVFMIISILINTFFDHVLVRLKRLDKSEMASIRLTGMLYMIIIFCYIKFIYEDNNYDMFITYFLTLMIGRFVYFDASFKDFLECMKQAVKNIPIMAIALAFLGILCFRGYSTDYLLKHNGVITNIFFCHLYIIVAIFIMHFVIDMYFNHRRKLPVEEMKPERKPNRKPRQEIEQRPKPRPKQRPHKPDIQNLEDF